MTRRTFVRGAAYERRNQRANVTRVAGEFVGSFAVVTGIGRQRLDTNRLQRLVQRLAIVRDIRPGTTARNEREDEMAGTVTDDPHLGKTFVMDVLRGFSTLCFAPHVIAAGVMRLQACPVHRRQADLLLHPVRFNSLMDRLSQHAFGASKAKQSS